MVLVVDWVDDQYTALLTKESTPEAFEPARDVQVWAISVLVDVSELPFAKLHMTRNSY